MVLLEEARLEKACLRGGLPPACFEEAHFKQARLEEACFEEARFEKSKIIRQVVSLSKPFRCPPQFGDLLDTAWPSFVGFRIVSLSCLAPD